LQKLNKKQKGKKAKYNNPFNDMFFWLSIVSADFSFGLIENNAELKPEPEKYTLEDK
jgi:hypothetical protein